MIGLILDTTNDDGAEELQSFIHGSGHRNGNAGQPCGVSFGLMHRVCPRGE